MTTYGGSLWTQVVGRGRRGFSVAYNPTATDFWGTVSRRENTRYHAAAILHKYWEITLDNAYTLMSSWGLDTSDISRQIYLTFARGGEDSYPFTRISSTSIPWRPALCFIWRMLTDTTEERLQLGMVGLDFPESAVMERLHPLITLYFGSWCKFEQYLKEWSE